MKILNRNKRKFFYCLYSEQAVQYDEYGNETSEPLITYGTAVPMYANISQATGQSNTEMFGNLESYDKVIVTDDMECPIDENSVLFIDKEPEYRDNIPVYDYIVRRVAKSLNCVAIAVRKVTVA